MRTLLIMRGAPGSGKSTWIKQNNLEQFTLEADKFRTLVQNPVLNESGEFHITQKNDRNAWDMLLQCLEQRMQRGDFTIVDATHTTQKLTKKYVELAEKYKYQCFVKVINPELETILAQNRARPEHKRVPEDAIERAHALVRTAKLPNRFKPIDNFNQIDNYFVENTDKFTQVKVFGDIHGCFDPVKEYLGSNPAQTIKDSTDTLYVFVGDFLDRGPQNAEVLKFQLDIIDLPNVRIVESNHIYEYVWARDEEIKSRKFKADTLPQIEAAIESGYFGMKTEELKSKLRQAFKRIRQCYAFEFNSKKYLVSYGGVTSVPKLTLISTQEFVKGVGDYETDVGAIYDQNYKDGKCQDFIQIHGHRNVTSGEYSYCLESNVERGGHLSIAEITRNGFQIAKIKNDNFVVQDPVKHLTYRQTKKDFVTENPEINAVLAHGYVESKLINEDTISIQFSESAFRKGVWDEMTVKARGLFVDAKTGKVKARGYQKFFNYKEQKETSEPALKKNLKFPVIAWEKYNGFLGIVSHDHGELKCYSKTTDVGDHVSYLQEIIDGLGQEFKSQLLDVLARNDATATFEVCHPLDPHITEECKQKSITLLDFIPNRLDLHDKNLDREFTAICTEQFLSEINYDKVNSNPEYTFGVKTGEVLENWDQVVALMDEDKHREFEGYVFEDMDGFMFKYKTEWYQGWKRRRGLVSYYLKRPNDRFEYRKCQTPLDVEFMQFVTDLNIEEVKNKSIVELREMYYNN